MKYFLIYLEEKTEFESYPELIQHLEELYASDDFNSDDIEEITDDLGNEYGASVSIKLVQI